MSLYEICNPSDRYSIVSDSEVVACVAVMLLGEGAYPLTGKTATGEERTVCPAFMFGGDPVKWMQDTYATSIDDVIAYQKPQLAEVLDSVRIGDPSERASMQDAEIALGREWMLKRHDEKRSSINDIGRRAWKLAERLRRPTP